MACDIAVEASLADPAMSTAIGSTNSSCSSCGHGVGSIGSSSAAPVEPKRPIEMATRVAGRFQMSRTKPKRAPTLAIARINEGRKSAGATPLSSLPGTVSCTGAAGGNACTSLADDILDTSELLESKSRARCDSWVIAAEAAPY